MRGKKLDEDTLSARVFKRDRSPVKTIRKIHAKPIIIVLSVILLFLCIALAVAGNFLFDFALNPNASFTMSDWFQGGEVEGIGNGPVIQLTPPNGRRGGSTPARHTSGLKLKGRA